MLPLRRQLVLYLDPASLFMDVAGAPAAARRRALAYNRAMRWMLVPYLKRWLFIAAALFLGVAPVEAAAAQSALLLVPAVALAAGFCVAFTVATCIGAAYLLLGASRDE